MKNWADLTKSESAYIVKNFCELQDTREFTIREIASILEISKESAGMLATLRRIYEGKPYQNKPRKTNRNIQRKSRSRR